MLAARFPDLRRMAVACVGELAEVKGVGFAQACRIKAAVELGVRLSERPFRRGDKIPEPGEVYQRIGRRLSFAERETLVGIGLDVKNRVLVETTLALGGVCSIEILPRDVFMPILREGAAAAIFVHNHPSGDPRPSEDDRRLTRRLAAAGADFLGVRVLDHIIVGDQGFFSFAESSSDLGGNSCPASRVD